MRLDNKSLTPAQDATRCSILDAAGELFARYGYKKTTMEDIALTLHKGKSSLYYYFKNKEEIFQAVIESETEILLTRLYEIVNSDLSSQNKFRKYVVVRMETVNKLKNYQNVLKDEMSFGYNLVEPLKKKVNKSEEKYLKTILNEGVKSGIFQIKDTQLAAFGIATALKGLELPLFNNETNLDDFNEQLENILTILFYGIIKR